MRFLTKKNVTSNEKSKFMRFKRQCRLVVEKLVQLHQQYQTHHCTLVIGQPECGKSILCSSSGKLIFSTQTDTGEKKIFNKEFAFEIYLLNDTLFFQIPNDLFLFSENRQQHYLWHFIAVQLRKYYLHLPTTHCLVCIDLHDFLTRSKISNDTRLSQITQALNILAGTLKKPLDVALFFTKADLLPGFVEFFNHESKEFLEQAWGYSLDESAPEALSNECEQLIRKLNERLLHCLHREVHTENLYLIKAFPLIFENVKQKLVENLPDFLSQWNSNPYLSATHLYFTSCRQFKELTESANPESNAIKLQNQKNSHNHFFTKQALENQRYYQEINTHAFVEKGIRVTFIILCALLFTAFTLYTAQQFSRHIKLIQAVNKTVESSLLFSKTPYAELKLTDVVNELNEISTAWEDLNTKQQSSLIEKHIFTRENKLETQLQNAYQQIISKQWLPLINQRLEDYINTHLGSDPANAYIAFNIYLMLSQSDWPIDTQYIQLHLVNLINADEAPMKLLPGNIHKNILVDDEESPFVQKVRASFAEISANKLAYVLLFSMLDTRHALDMTQLVEKQQPSLQLDAKFSKIPEIYTAKLFPDVYKNRLLSVANEAIHGNKVLGAYHHDDITEDALLEKLQEEYLQLYCDSWEQTIQHIQLTPTSSLEDFFTQLQILTSVDSPILALLNLSQINTSMPQIEQASAFLTELNNTLTKKSTPENNALYRSFALLMKLHDQKNDACILLADENASTPQNPSVAKQISILATQLPQPIQTWLQQIVDSYYLVLQQQAGNCQ